MKTSRTFALAIPLLPAPTREAVALSYLLFRIADTFEDAESWVPEARAAALDVFIELLDATAKSASREERVALITRAGDLGRAWSRAKPTHHASYLELLEANDEVFDALLAHGGEVRAIIVTHVRRTAVGMRDVALGARATGRVEIETLQGLRDYCYLVAGIVGELLTALFVHDAPKLKSVEDVLVANERAFGEGLQLVNILKDEAGDVPEGRSFLPAGVTRAEVVNLARTDLVMAQAYIEALERAQAPSGFLAFVGLPATLAKRNLEVLEQFGAGAKVPRDEVLASFAHYRELAEADHSASAQSGK